MKTFKLCMINEEDYSRYGVAYFTDNFEHQIGDDWDDVPYEHNAGEPYDTWSELIEDNEDLLKRKWKTHPVKIKKIYFEFDNEIHVPCSDTANSPYSVDDINKGVVAWLWNDNFKLFAGTTMEEFIKTVKENGGKIYMEV